MATTLLFFLGSCVFVCEGRKYSADDSQIYRPTNKYRGGCSTHTHTHCCSRWDGGCTELVGRQAAAGRSVLILRSAGKLCPPWAGGLHTIQVQSSLSADVVEVARTTYRRTVLRFKHSIYTLVLFSTVCQLVPFLCLSLLILATSITRPSSYTHCTDLARFSTYFWNLIFCWLVDV